MILNHTIVYVDGGCFGNELKLSVTYYYHAGDESTGTDEGIDVQSAKWDGVDKLSNLTVEAIHNIEEDILDERKGAPLDRREDDE